MFVVVDAQNSPKSGLHGIDVAAPSNVIGGSGAGQGNLISGNVGPDLNSGIGILFQGNAPGNLVAGNMIGVTAAGESSLANVYGIYFGNPANANSKTSTDVVTQETIGGTTGNLISGNFIGISGTGSGAVISRNIIGPDKTGKAMLPDNQPGAYGIFLNANGTTIGGTNAGNIVSGIGTAASPGIGIELAGDTDVIQGNYVGTNGPGTSALPNAIGMNLHLTNGTVGGTAKGSGNVVSGNLGDGIRLDTNGPTWWRAIPSASRPRGRRATAATG